MPDIDLKALTSTSLPMTGFLFGADSQAVGTTSPSVYSTQAVATTLLGSTSLTGATLTADAPVLNLAQTWNNGAVTFKGVVFNAAGTSDANSAAASLLMDLQVNTSGRFRVSKTGQIVLPYSATTDWVAGNVSFGNRYGSPTLQNTNALMNMDAQGNVNTGGGGGLGSYQINGDTILSRKAIRNFRFGAADAAAPFAQTLSVQSVVAGTSNTAGADFTLTGSQGTGTGLAGNLIVSTGFSNTVGTATVTITIATPGVITWTAHGLVTGSPVVFTTTGALPTGITAGTTYFAITSSALGVNTFQIATTAALAEAGTAVATSGTQSGVQTATTSATVQSPLMTTTTFGPSGLTGSQTTPVLDLKQNWNTSGNATALELNVTNVASGASALLMDLQVDTVSKFAVAKDGSLSLFNAGVTTVRLVNTANGIIAFNNSGVQLSSNAINNFSISGASVNLSSGQPLSWSSDTFITRKNTRILQLGQADAATALAQTLSVQSVVGGTTDGAGQPFTINGSQGTGTGAGGSIVFQVAPAAGSTGTTQNALVSALTIGSNRSVTMTDVNTSPSALLGISNVSFGFSSTGFIGVYSSATRRSTIGNSYFTVNSGGNFSFSSDSNGITGDLFLTRVAAGVLKVAGTSGTGPGVVVTNSTVVASLPAAATAGAGAFAFVTDATMTMALGIGTAVVGGGANKVPVYSDGASWLIG